MPEIIQDEYFEALNALAKSRVQNPTLEDKQFFSNRWVNDVVSENCSK